jgi:hypothetical protein
MTASTNSPATRAEFDSAMTAILSEHATLRRLAAAASRRPGFSTDDALSLADAMSAHESTEARLFSLPFLTRPPKSVTSTGARARQRCLDYTSGNFSLPDASAAAALFVDALVTHLATKCAVSWHDHCLTRTEDICLGTDGFRAVGTPEGLS